MAKKGMFQPGYSTSLASQREIEGSGSSGRMDIDIAACEVHTPPMSKFVDLNSALGDGFAVPVQVLPLSKLSQIQRKGLVQRLTSELEQIRLLQKKVESEREKVASVVPLSSSGDVHGSNVQQKGPALGLGLVPRKKEHGWTRGKTGKFKSLKSNKLINTNAGLLKQCESLLKRLMSHKHAQSFNSPVDAKKYNIPDYYDVIKNPMDLGTIKKKLSSRKYASPVDFAADVRLTFNNAKTYNPPGNIFHSMADEMATFFEERWKAIEKKLLPATTVSLPEKYSIQEETEILMPVTASKKRKVSPTPHEDRQESVKEMMTDEEKHKLSEELEDLLEDLPENVIDFLRAQSSSKGDLGDDEIEIDIDKLSNDTLFTLRKLLDDHKRNKQNCEKSEACEIELPNEPGLSNSSLKADKGNDPIDEDVDIGGNEPAVSSHPPVNIEKTELDRKELQSEAECGGEADQLDQSLSPKPHPSNSDGHQDGESASDERQMSPEKRYRAALLKNRFADTILKAREKTLGQDDKGDPEKLRREREELEMHKRREKARLQAEAKAAEDARRRAEEDAAAEAKRRRELEREKAREALLKMERTVEINENSQFLEDLEMLSSAPPEQLPSYADETSPDCSQDGFGSFKFKGSNPLEQLGLYMKVDEEEEEGEPPGDPRSVDDIEEGEID